MTLDTFGDDESAEGAAKRVDFRRALRAQPAREVTLAGATGVLRLVVAGGRLSVHAERHLLVTGDERQRLTEPGGPRRERARERRDVGDHGAEPDGQHRAGTRAQASQGGVVTAERRRRHAWWPGDVARDDEQTRGVDDAQTLTREPAAERASDGTADQRVDVEAQDGATRSAAQRSADSRR